MLRRSLNFLIDQKDRQRIAIALAKGTASMLGRTVNLASPRTWEFSGFSQNGEDGIIDILRQQLSEQNRYVVELGAAEGTENNSSWLLTTQGYKGLLVEADPHLSARARRNIAQYSIGSECIAEFITLDSVSKILKKINNKSPDVFSLDIDGNDYHIAQALVKNGFRPKIACVEYNSSFGPERSVTSKYNEDFRRTTAHPSLLYYGASIQAWKKLFRNNGYVFVTVESNGVNAFFVDPGAFDKNFLAEIDGIPFAENQYQLRAHGKGHAGQFALIQEQPLVDV